MSETIWVFVCLVVILILYKYLSSIHNLQFSSKVTNHEEEKLNLTSSNGEIYHYSWDNHFPKYIPRRSVRVHNGVHVSRGRLELLGGVSSFATDENSGRWNDSMRIPLVDFQRVLQCAPIEPDLTARRGVLGLMQLLWVTKESILAGCAMIERNARCEQLRSCSEWAKEYLAGKTALNEDFDKNIRLVRVIAGKLYYDWPWGMERFKKGADWSISRLLGGVLEKVGDIPDSVFFLRDWDMALFPGHIALPALSHAPTTHHADLPLPWGPVIDDEILFHTKQVVGNVTVYPDLNPAVDDTWSMRKPKAAFFGALFGERAAGVSRQVLLDLAVLRPDLVDAGFTAAHRVHAYTFDSQEIDELDTIVKMSKTSVKAKAKGIVSVTSESSLHGPGSLSHIAQLHLSDPIDPVTYMRSYKYLVVLAGSGPSGRLCTFLAHSGAVVLLQETEYLYHFSHRLEPWVHYVPLAFTVTDLLTKVEWLRTHDKEARQIAANGRAFALSYLRLEDYYCYIAAVLKAFGDVANKTALEAFSPMPFVVPSGPKAGKFVQQRRRPVRKRDSSHR